MTEKLNTSNISILLTNTKDQTGIRSIVNGVTDKVKAKTLLEQGNSNPNQVTKATVSIIESILQCKINEEVNNQYMFFRFTMPNTFAFDHKKRQQVVSALKDCMAVADNEMIRKWILEVMVCTNKQSALKENDMALKAKVYASKLQHIPADILKNACDKLCYKESWFPALADIMKYVEPEYYYRKSLVELVSSKLIQQLK
tara:strand:+ start:1026 stop:1625 length:600 start_codon:yes stop_codon:yes gene_type:complete